MGADGLGLGLEAAEFETAVAVEMDPDSIATYHERDRMWLRGLTNSHPWRSIRGRLPRSWEDDAPGSRLV
jgi:site-specific DNA-cytosine methylase